MEQYWDTTTRTATNGYPNESTISVQEQLDSWKLQQLQQQQQQQPSSPYVDRKGQTKLLVSINKTSRAVIFFIYMWRILHLYESVTGHINMYAVPSSSSSSSFSRTTAQSLATHLWTFRPVSILSVPLLLLFLSNMLATITLVVSTETNHSTKKRLKAILNMNKLVEVMVIAYTFIRLTIVPSPYVTKEIYIGRILHSILFIIQGQAYTRFSWDSEAIAPSFQQAASNGTTDPVHRATTTTTTPTTVTTPSHYHQPPPDTWSNDESYSDQR